MRVTIDRQRCQGHALCVMFGPDIFALDEYGHATVDGVAVPPAVEAAVRAVAARCPERAIRIDGDDRPAGETQAPPRRGNS